MKRRGFLQALGLGGAALPTAALRQAAAQPIPVPPDTQPLTKYDDKPGNQGPVVEEFDLMNGSIHIDEESKTVRVDVPKGYSGVLGPIVYSHIQDWLCELVNMEVEAFITAITRSHLRLFNGWRIDPIEAIRFCAVEDDSFAWNSVVAIGKLPHDCPISWEVGGRSGWSPWKGLADLGGRTAFTDEVNPMQNFMVPHVPGATMRVMARDGSFEYKLGTTPHLIHVPFHVMIPAE